MLTLGGVTFQGFELPEKINFGGKQTLITHKLPGGGRVIDAMGRDDDDITWQGRFRSNSAGSRARTLDAMRIAGRPGSLAWGNYRFQVLIAEFRADFEQRYEIPYSITCVIQTAPQATTSSLLGLLNTDLSSITSLADGLGTITDAVNSVKNAVDTAKALKQGLSGGLPGILGAVAGARGVVSQLASTTDSLLGSTTGDFASDLLSQASAAAHLDQLQSVGNSLGRMATTIQGLRA